MFTVDFVIGVLDLQTHSVMSAAVLYKPKSSTSGTISKVSRNHDAEEALTFRVKQASKN